MSFGIRVESAPADLIAGAIVALSFWALVGLHGCAHTAAPSGGPADTIPPILIEVRPESLSVAQDFDDEVRFEFNEAISERDVRGAVIVYPFEARPRVKKGGSNLRVRPRAGWIENLIYHVRVEAVIQDLFNNRIPEPIEYAFSTGVALTQNVVSGTVFDRITARPLAAGRVDMVLLPDTVRYGTASDSVGAFRLRTVPEGEYLVIAYEDLNSDRRADNFDRSDTVRVSLAASDSLVLDFSVFRHDTIGPSLNQVRPVDSLTLELQFDGFLDPDSALTVGSVQVLALPDSTPLAVDTVLHAWQAADWREARRLAARAAADSLAADTIPRDTLTVDTLAADTVDLGPGPEATPPDDELAELEETELQPAEPLPAPRIVVVLQDPLAPGEYLVSALGIVNITGLAATSSLPYQQTEPDADDDSEGG